MYFGVDYYPEHWQEERWPLDTEMMRGAGMNIVRLAEFAWAKIEPEEGVYDFSWLDKVIEILAREGIRIILGTPTAAAPKWLMDKHPDIYPVDFHGLTKGFGTRRHYCPNNRHYREYSRVITQKMVEHYRHNPNIVAWQIDNELGAQCFCESCHKAFQSWLEKKYKTVESMNNQWGTIFWSQTYRSFNEVPMPLYSSSDCFTQNAGAGIYLSTPYNHNPGFLLDFFRFSSNSISEFQDIQIEIIRQGSVMPITHNYMGHYSELDYFKLGKNLDFISWDNYPNNMWSKVTYSNVSMGHDLMRGIKRKNFWVIEQQSGPCGWQMMGDTPEPGQLRLWTYQSIAHGADAIVYFRWRACTFGIEQYWYGVLDHDGIGRRRYREITEIGQELERLSELLLESEIKSEVLLVKSYDNFWSHRGQPHNSKFSYNDLLQGYYDGLSYHHVNIDVSSVETDFSSYKIVLMPAFNLMTEEIAQKCENYVNNGGVLLITFRSGTRDWNNRMTMTTLPGYFKDLSGVELEEFDSLNFERKVRVAGEFGETYASIWCDVLKSNGAKSLASYASYYYQGSPAVTENDFGKGKVFYVGCDLDEKAMWKMMGLILEKVGVSPAIDIKTSGIEVVKKEKSDKEYLVLLNHNNYQVLIDLKERYIEAISGKTVNGELIIPGYGVAILLVLQS